MTRLQLSDVPFACAWRGVAGQLGESTWVPVEEAGQMAVEGVTKEMPELRPRDVSAARDGAELEAVHELLPVVEFLSPWIHL